MGRVGALLLAGIVLTTVLVGCGPLQKRTDSPHSRLRTTARIYETTMKMLADARAAGQLSPATVKRVTHWHEKAEKAFKAWKKALAEGKNADTPRAHALRAIAVLQEILESPGDPPETGSNQPEGG